MELSTQDKARVFAMYLNAESPTICTRIDDEDKIELMLCGVNTFDEFVQLSDMDGGIFWDEGFNNVQLLLKPLYDISDEDLVTIAQFQGYDGFESIEDERPLYLRNTGRRYIKNVIDYNTADFLRSKSYALPYKGIDLFEAGIAINVNDKNK